VRARPHQPAQIDTDAERIAIELQRDAPAEVEFEVDVAKWFVVDPCVEAIVANEVGGATCYAGGSKPLAVRGGAAGAALGG